MGGRNGKDGILNQSWLFCWFGHFSGTRGRMPPHLYSGTALLEILACDSSHHHYRLDQSSWRIDYDERGYHAPFYMLLSLLGSTWSIAQLELFGLNLSSPNEVLFPLLAPKVTIEYFEF